MVTIKFTWSRLDCISRSRDSNWRPDAPGKQAAEEDDVLGRLWFDRSQSHNTLQKLPIVSCDVILALIGLQFVVATHLTPF